MTLNTRFLLAAAEESIEAVCSGIDSLCDGDARIINRVFGGFSYKRPWDMPRDSDLYASYSTIADREIIDLSAIIPECTPFTQRKNPLHYVTLDRAVAVWLINKKTGETRLLSDDMAVDNPFQGDHAGLPALMKELISGTGSYGQLQNQKIPGFVIKGSSKSDVRRNLCDMIRVLCGVQTIADHAGYGLVFEVNQPDRNRRFVILDKTHNAWPIRDIAVPIKGVSFEQLVREFPTMKGTMSPWTVIVRNDPELSPVAA